MSRFDDRDSAWENEPLPPRSTDSKRAQFTHRWECPYCEASRGVSLIGEDAAERGGAGRAETALQSHILSSVDDAHGPKHELPPDLDPDSLMEYVTRIE